MQIHKLELNAGASIFYDPNFRIVLDDHMSYLRSHPKTQTVNVEAIYADKYEGDLSGLLSHYNIPIQNHWTIMRLNGYTSFSETDFNLRNLLIPDFDIVDQIRHTYRTIQNKIKT